MTALVTKHLPLVAGAPEGIKKLRTLILELAVRGKLVPQNIVERGTESNAIAVHQPHSTIDVLGPFALPEQWRWVRLGDTLEMVNGRAFKPSEWTKSGLPIVRIQNLNKQEAEFNYCDESKVAPRHIINTGTLLISWSGTPGTSFGAFIWGRGRAALNQHIFSCTQKTPSFFDRFLQIAINTRMAELIAKAHGGVGLQHVTKGKLEALTLALPPLAEQHLIVTKVDELMALCDRLEADQADAEAAHAQLVQALLDSLTQATDAADFRASWQRLSEHFHTLFTTEASIDALKQAVLQLAVMGKLAGQSLNDEPAEILLNRIQEHKKSLVAGGTLRKQRLPPEIDTASVPYELPRGWSWVRWESVTMKIGDIDHKMPETTTDGIPFVSPRDFYPGNVIDFDGAKRVAIEDYERLSAKIKAERGDLIYPRYGTIGENVIVDVDRDFLVSYSCAVIKVAKGFIDPMYQYYCSLSACIRRQAKAAENKTTQANVGIKSIQEFLFPLPPLAEQQRIVAKVDELMTLCDQLKAQLAEARQQHAQLATVLVEQAVA